MICAVPLVNTVISSFIKLKVGKFKTLYQLGCLKSILNPSVLPSSISEEKDLPFKEVEGDFYFNGFQIAYFSKTQAFTRRLG
jgi:hypothetical protein